ncbi:energy-coupling factor transporter transmembrane component T [Anoxynatronum buryatiense]|uniref:Energy-coupling factor transport system permease protein n=1 Tax=Anoxynatronum buryatiense TaxID=489973 RepID=A0AA45WYH4_9CLOT|nr:energy-coupling factor transporter transmembrane component T [Anoxynatronum buryatiense]SMP68733.1 energy-coupling factor transport system permease protein [Anoxynatronum buryatiense]
MPRELMQSSPAQGRFSLDPRSKLLLLLTGSTILIAGSPQGIMTYIRPVFVLLPLALLFLSGRSRVAGRFALIYLAALLAEQVLLPLVSGLGGFLLVAVLGILTRFIPSLALGYYMVSTTTVSEFIAAMERMRIPRQVVIPFAVMFRFFPTVLEESRAIGDAMRMRGIGGIRLLKNPLTMLEYRLVPMMMTTVKIGEELSASALTRGLGNPVARTNICRLRFGVVDALLSAMAVAAFACFLTTV